jgi:hypothetical protein
LKIYDAIAYSSIKGEFVRWLIRDEEVHRDTFIPWLKYSLKGLFSSFIDFYKIKGDMVIP